ncbi:mechanosensitive ion channel family protein [Craterilacuibacter sp.]|uniref:mechanosensitive ion channel family protein n=1 Tax=Craterilacuibacter sp. TaxID=2870909 RepID=UPI003F40F61E
MLQRDELIFDSLSAILQTGMGMAQLAVGLACGVIAWLMSGYVYRRFYRSHPERSERFMSYMGLRLAMPLIALLLLIISIFGWKLLAGSPAKVLATMATLMFWLSVIRVISAVLRQALPRGRFESGSEHFMAMVLWLLYASWATGIDAFVIEWMQSIAFTVGKTRLDLLMIINAILWVSVIVIGALWVSRAIESRLMRLKDLDLSLRIVFSKIARTGLLVAAVLIALPVVGIDLTVLSVFGGALGVGLGFGLQKIASNYVSGFIILLDRSIRIGDRLEVEGRLGVVTKITSRFIVLKSADGSEALVPNEVLISSTVINTSYSDKAIWTSLPIGVAYGTDLELALRLLREAAVHPRVLKEPGPAAFVLEFADSSINLSLGIWVSDPENGFLGLKSDINLTIWRKFQENGIQIPFPQREVRLLQDAA